MQDYYNSSVIKSITDDAKNTTTVPAVSPPQSAEWLYDSEGRLEAIKYAGSQASSSQDTFSRMTYDPVTGFVDTIEDAEGVVLKYHYDTGLLNRLEVTSPVNPQGTREMSFNYDGDDRLTTGKDVTTGHEIQLEYDSLDGVVAEKQGTHRVTYSREGERRRTMLHHPAPGAFLVTYTVDRQGRLAHIRVGNRLVVRFQYRLPTQLRRRTQGLLRSDYEHDDNGVVETITITGFASGNDLRFDITRDNDGRIETCSQTQGAVNISWTWEYDEPGRIKSEVLLTDNAGTIEQVTTTRLFDGDDVLRREQIQVSDGTTTLSGNTFERTREERGRILSETNAPTLTYDKNGNLIQFGTTEYKFDAWQRLIQVLRGGQIIADYEYDTLHRLVLRRTPEDVETYIYDGGHLIEVRRDDEVIERYVYSGAIDDAVYAEISSDQYHVLSDPMGNIHAVVDAQGQVRQFYRYSLRGRCEVLDAGYNVVTESPAVRLLFQRRVWDSVSGLYYFRARWYSSELGIFLTADPSGYGEGTEHYGLNHGDSINFTDPFGLDDKPNNAGDVADGLKKAGRQRTPVAVRDLAALRGEFHVVEHFKDIPSDEAVIAITKTGERQVWIDPKSERWRRIFGKEFTDIAGDVDHVYSKARAKQQGYGYVRLADVPAGPNRSAGAGWEKKILKLPIQPGGTPAVRYSSLKDETKLSGIKVGGKRKGYPGMQLFARRIRRIPVVKIIAPLVFSYAVLKTGDARAASRSFFTPSQEKLRREWPDAPMVEWERAVANDVAMQDPFAVAGEIHNVAFERHLERVMPQREVAWHKMSAVDIRPEEKRRISLAAKGPGGMVLANILAIPDRIEGAWDDNVATPVTETYDRIIHLIDYGEWK